MVVADVSFISLTLLMGPLVSVTRDDGWLLLLVKPQFEVGRELLGKDGVVRSAAHHVLGTLERDRGSGSVRLALRSRGTEPAAGRLWQP